MNRTLASTLIAALLCLLIGAPTAARTYRVVGGSVATSAQLYGTVAIVEKGTPYLICTGTLITPTVVLSASHCFKDPYSDWEATPEMIDIIAGALNVENAQAQHRFSVKKIATHQDYTESQPIDPTGLGKDNDISLLVLDKPVTTLTPVPLLPSTLYGDVFKVGYEFIVSGFGMTSEDEQTAEVGILYVGTVAFEKKSDYEILLSSKEKVDTCSGDSGGPAYVKHGGKIYLAGITSRARYDGQSFCGDGGLYTLTPAYAKWTEVNSDGEFTIDGTPTVPVADAQTPNGDASTPVDDASAPVTPDVVIIFPPTGVDASANPGSGVDTVATVPDLSPPTNSTTDVNGTAGTTNPLPTVGGLDATTPYGDTTSTLQGNKGGGCGVTTRSNGRAPLFFALLLVVIVGWRRRFPV